MLHQIDTLFQLQPYLCLLYKAIFTVAYFRFFRVSELVWTESGHMVLAKNVNLGRNKRKLMFVLETSKMHSKACKPQIIKIAGKQMQLAEQKNNSTQKNSWTGGVCPLTIVQQYLQMRGSYKDDSEPFFVFRDKSLVTATQTNIVLKKVIKSLGFDNRLYSFHGFRIDRTTDMLQMGVL